jgi:ElaB/YqjD/DUF883 family membrane-anchored ribosome-binding protein
MDQAKNIKETINDLRGTIDKARHETVEAASKAIEKGEKILGDIRHRGEEALHTAQEKGRDIIDDVAEQSSEGVLLAKRYVRRNPGKAVGLALVAGVVLGALFFSGDDE